MEEKLSPEYHALYYRLWEKYKGINLKKVETWKHIPEEELHIMIYEPPLRTVEIKVDPEHPYSIILP